MSMPMTITAGVAMVIIHEVAGAVRAAGVPEIDPGLAQSALMVLAGGVLMLKGQRRK